MSQTIWYISKYVAPPEGASVGGRAYEIMRECAALGHRCIIITSDANHLIQPPSFAGSVLHQQRDGLDLYWLRTFKAPAARSWQRILSWIHFEWRLLRFDDRSLPRPDAVIVSSLSLLTVLNGLRLKRRYRTRLVFEVRDIWPLTLTVESDVSPLNPVVRLLGLVEKIGYQRADAIVGTMPGLDDHVRKVLDEERTVHCIPQGFSPRAVSEDPPAPAPRTPGLIVGYAGTVGASNALEVLFDAARLLRHETDIRFVVLGDGPLLARFKDQCADLESVTFVPRVSKGEVAAELEKCHLLYVSMYPSRRWEYGQSLNKLIDYMLSGRPVLASYSGRRSMIDEAGSGSFVPAGDTYALADEIRRYAAMPPEERERMGRRGWAWVMKNRSLKRLATQYLDVMFPDALQEPRRGAHE